MAKDSWCCYEPCRPSSLCMYPQDQSKTKLLTTYRVVTINILVRLRQSRDTLHKVKKQVSLLRGELVCCAVLKRSRTKWVDGVFSLLGTCWLRIYTTRLKKRLH